jgi:phthalate 4,5-dioxygenase reductase subunit
MRCRADTKFDMSNTHPDAHSEPADFLTLVIAEKIQVARDVWAFSVSAPDRTPLPAFTPGSHVTVVTPRGMRRNYSLCGHTSDVTRYDIAIKRDAAGRGGSISMVDELTVGDVLRVSPPRNNFELAARAKAFLFIAGGIGITPILSMMRHVRDAGSASFKLIYCARDEESMAFADCLQREFPGQVVFHHDRGDAAQAYDFWPLLETPTAAHVYCCGPKGLMDSVADMSGHWPSGSVHFESFGVDAQALSDNTAFTVRLARSAQTMTVGAEQSIIEALRAHGHEVRSSCESGTCGTCKTGLISGAADHRDMVLRDDERDDHIMICVSRATSAELVLDL